MSQPTVERDLLMQLLQRARDRREEAVERGEAQPAGPAKILD